MKLDINIDDVHVHKPSKSKDTVRVFKNDLLEWLSQTHIAVPLILFSIISIGFIYYGIIPKGMEGDWIAIMFFSGFLTFTFIEYITYRYLYHIVTNSKIGKRFIYLIHGIHHDYPKDRFKLAMPIPASLLLSLLFFLLYYAITGVNIYGFLMGYVVYLWIHYMIHVFTPPKNIFNFFWIHHSFHHYKKPDRGFGVTSPLWDIIFRTMPIK